MTIRLGDNQYGKAETHVVRVTKGAAHELKDMTVSIALGRRLRRGPPHGR